MAITHAFVNQKADGADATITRPSDWNADHVVPTDAIVQNNYAPAGAPTVNDDSGDGYSVGSTWVYAGTVYTLTDSTVGAAVWASSSSVPDVVLAESRIDAYSLFR